jgi:hypothetical protein
MSDTSALERVLVDACFGETADAELRAGVRAFVDARGVVGEDAEAIAAAPPRLAVYRSLVQNGIKTVVGRVLPRTRAHLDASSSSGRFEADFAHFLDAVGPRTHYLRDVPGEFVAWALPRWRDDPTVPAHVPDLSVHEIISFTAASAPDDLPAAAVPVALDRPLSFTRSARLVCHAWRVHELSEHVEGRDLPVRGPVHLLAYRDAEHAVSWLELSPLAASIVEILIAGGSLGDAVESACRVWATTPTAVATDVARLLADLAERGIVLGAA